MTEQYFSVENCTSLSDIPAGACIHVIGVCGVAMAQLTVALAESGYIVSGSDKEFYEPMAGLLAKTAIRTFTGFHQNNIPEKTSLVIIGNSISRDNIEVQETERRKLSYSMFPKIVGDLLIAEKKSIVISGTHGKSTTTALGAHVLSVAKRSPSFFVGGLIKNYERSLVVANGNESIVEGDEYDSAFFAKVPKFTFYKPQLLTITSLEFDHADIYSDLSAIEKEFETLVRAVPDNGRIAVCLDDINIKRLLPFWRSISKCPVVSYGFDQDSDAVIKNQRYKDGIQTFELSYANQSQDISVALLGKHNARNATSIFLTMQMCNLSTEEINRGLSSYPGVLRRQDVRYQNSRTIVLEDFAHHPTAVKETLSAIRQGYPGRRIVCAFEPRSNTSRRKVFEHDYGNAFQDASTVYLKSVSARHNDSGIEFMNIQSVADAINRNGSQVNLFDDTETLLQALIQEDKVGTLIVVMSNGSFDGLIDKLISSLSKVF
jgi:UDP-N-acetylmuramate: L-alanyl-gamma-D-glutamyl-meso-diaminopimelate ligase